MSFRVTLGLSLLLHLSTLPGVVAQAPWETVTGFTPDASGLPGVTAITLNPRNARTVWFGATEDRLFVSHDGGRSVRPAGQIPIGEQSGGRPAGRITAIVIHPSDTTLMFAGSTGGFYVSRNGGATWQHTLSTPRVQVAGPSIVVDPGNPDLLYAGLYRTFAIGGPLRFSPDRGGTWVQPNGGQLGGSTAFTALATAGGLPLLSGARTAGGLLRLNALDDRWLRTYTVTGRSDAWEVTRILFDPRDSRVVWAVVLGEEGPGVLLNSTNAGQSWREVSLPLGVAPGTVEIDATGRLYVGEWRHGAPGLYLSVDEGRTWAPVPIPGLPPGATAQTTAIRALPAGVLLADERHGVFRLEGVPPPAARAARVYPVETSLVPLAGGRVRAERTAAGPSGHLAVMGLQESGQPFAGLFTFAGERVRISQSGTPPDVQTDTVAYVVSYNAINLPLGLWNGDVLFEDLTGDGKSDVLITGNAARDSGAAVPQTLLYLDARGTSMRVNTTLPHLHASRLALRDNLLALAGRSATGTVLDVYRVTRAATPTFTRLASLPGLELPALAWGDCDGDGDRDLFAAGTSEAGNPMATLYRNDGGAFNAVATLPGLYRGDAAFGDVTGDGVEDLAYSGFRYSPGGAEGNVYLYRMTGCSPTLLAVPEPMRTMMADAVMLEDFDLDGDLDLIVAGLDPPFFKRRGGFRVARNDAQGGLSVAVDQEAVGIGGGTFARVGVPIPRPSFVGMGLSDTGLPKFWFYTRIPSVTAR